VVLNNQLPDSVRGNGLKDETERLSVSVKLCTPGVPIRPEGQSSRNINRAGFTVTKAEQRRQEWEKRIAEYRASGMSVKEWCSANGVKPDRLWYWLRRTRQTLETKSTMWVPVELSSIFPGEQASDGSSEVHR